MKKILGWVQSLFRGPRRQLLHFGDDFVIRELKALDLKDKCLFDKKKNRAWPLDHKLLVPTNGAFPYVELVTDYGILDPFALLTAEESANIGDGKKKAISAIREAMHENVKKASGHTSSLILGLVAAIVFVMVLLVVLLWVKGNLQVA